MPTLPNILAADLEPEAFVRQALSALEIEFRELALIALADWEQIGLAAPRLYRAIAALQRPSWGSWNGLVSALRETRRGLLRSGTALQRATVESAHTLTAILQLLEQRLDKPVLQALAPLATLVRFSLGRRARIEHALTLPISLRNRVAHDAPTDADWWTEAAAALRPLVEWYVAANPVGDVWPTQDAWPSPWFRQSDGERWSFNGVNRDFAIIYTNGSGVSEFDETRSQSVTESMQCLLGRAETQDKDFRKLLRSLTPEDIKGVLLGDVLVGRPVGHGGFATVHVGRQLSTGRKVAVKILHDGMDEDARLRFQQEAAFLSRFTHPHIVSVLGYGEEPWIAPRLVSLSDEPWFEAFAKTAPVKSFIVLEWIDGETLEAVFQNIRSGTDKIEQRQIALWFEQVAGALDAVHGSGLIHRDVKPGNVMIRHASSGNAPIAQLMDFGIARSQSDARTLVTSAGVRLGTDAYMPPEQLRASRAEEEVGPAADIYGLCATFYEVFTGKRFFAHDEEDADTVRSQKLRGDLPARPRKLASGLPWELETILLGGLQPEISDRYASVNALGRDIRHFLDDEAITYRRPGLWRRMAMGYRRNRTVVHLVGVSVLIFSIGLVLYVRDLQNARARTAEEYERAELERESADVARERAEQAASDAETQREIAQASLGTSQRRLAALFMEQGRRAWLDGNDDAALVYLAEAYQLGDEGPAMRYLLARAIERLHKQSFELVGHSDVVQSVRFSADGTQLLTGGEDNIAILWDASDGSEIRRLGGRSYGVEKVAFGADGALMVFGSGEVSMYTGTGEKLDIDTGGWTAEAWLTPEKQLITVTDVYDKGLEIVRWRHDQRSELTRYTGMTDPRGTGDPSGKVLLSNDRGTGYWHLLSPDGAWAKPLVSTGLINIAVTSPSGDRFMLSDTSQKKPSMWAADGTRVGELDGHEGRNVTGAAFSPDGTRIATTSLYDVLIHMTSSTRHVRTLQGHNDHVEDIAWSDDGALLATGDQQGQIRVWSTTDGKMVTMFEHGASIESLAFSPDGKSLASAGGHRRVRIWRVEAGRGAVQMHLSHGHDVSLSPDGMRVAAGGNDGQLAIWSAIDGERLAQISGFEKAVGVVDFAADGRLFAIGRGGNAGVFDVAGDFQFEIPVERSLNSYIAYHEGIAVVDGGWSPDGQFVVTVDGATAGKVWRADGKPQSVLSGHEERPHQALFSGTSDRVLTASLDRTIRIWALDGELKHTITLTEAHAIHLAASPDGTLVAAGCSDGMVRVYDVASGDPVFEVAAHPGTRSNFVQFSPDGVWLASAGNDRRALLWATETWERHAVLDHFERAKNDFATLAVDEVRTVVFSPDSALLASGSGRGTVRVWDIKTGLPLQLLHPAERPVVALDWKVDGLAAVTDYGQVWVWPTPLETRSPSKVAEVVATRSRYQLKDGRLVPRTQR